MQQPMPPQGAPAPAKSPAPEQGGGGASKIVSDVYSGLTQLLQMAEKAAPEDAQALAGIVSSFQGWVEQMGASPSAAAKAPAAPNGAVPAETRGREATPAL